VLTEKPATTSAQDTAELVALAGANGLVLMENFMFLHHSRHERVRRLLAEGAAGPVRSFHSTFTMPARPAGDIRLDPDLGGGALLDNGAYPVRAAQLLLGPDLAVAGAHLTTDPDHGVDIAGSALLYRSDGVAAQLTFGMDHHYLNDYHVHCAGGRLSVDRAFTPPADLATEITVARRGRVDRVTLPAEDQCAKTVAAFVAAVSTGTCPDAGAMVRQAALIDEIRDHARRVRA
jgi:dTDP-3,4-didehydro-2,6-dideoxy-alpha-D-glucose 3-reductase